MRSCPLWFLLVFAVISTDRERAMGTKSFKNENIGTVLFERSDYGKHCWTSEEFTVLNSRRMFQDILPKVKVINYENDQYIAHLMDYFHICLESVRKLSIGKTKHLMLKALADTMAGYLHVYILPLTKQSYYAGNIKYRNAKRLFELFDELKNFLRTNGAGWTKPRQETKHARVPPIVITPSKTSVACNGLIIYPTSSIGYDQQRGSVHFKKRKRFAKRKSLKSTAGHHDERKEDSFAVPLPFLDDNVEPNSIALPFKTDSLQPLYGERSAFALVKYYVASVKCISSKSKTGNELQTFNRDFYEWLQQSVYPRLDDEKWYPAFGGVLRIISALHKSGVDNDIVKGNGGTHQALPKIAAEHTVQPEEEVFPFYKKDEDTITFGTTELIVIAVVSALLVWLLVGLSLVCYKFLIKHSDECSPCDSPNTPVAVLYENADYCQPDTCPSKPSRKKLMEKLKEWWRNRFGRCPGGCQDRYVDEERCLAAISYSSKDTVNVSNGSKTCQRRKYAKSTSATTSSISPKRRASFRQRVCYSTDGSSTQSESSSKIG